MSRRRHTPRRPTTGASAATAGHRLTARAVVRAGAAGAAGLAATLAAITGAFGGTGPAFAAGPRSTVTTVTATKAVTGEAVTFTATVTDKAKVAVTGTVTFTITGSDGSSPQCDGGSDSITLTANATGTDASAPCSISAGLAAASAPFAVSAAYSGDGDDDPSGGSIAAYGVGLGPTTTSVSATTSPSVTGQPVSYTATVAAASPSTGTPTGSVTFTLAGADGQSADCDGGDTVGLTADSATCTLSGGLPARGDPYVVRAAYSGDTDFATSSGHVDQTVQKDTTTIALGDTAGTGTGGGPANTATRGETVTFTATVGTGAAPGSGTPTGSVVFTVTGANDTTATCDGGDVSPLSGGAAQCTFSAGLGASGSPYTVTATLRDPNFTTPTPATLTETIDQADTTVTLRHIYPTSLDDPVKAVATVATVGVGAGAPTGYVSFAFCAGSGCQYGGTVALPATPPGSAAPNTNVASLSIPGGLGAGYYTVTASYSGSDGFFPSVSAPLDLPVSKASTSTSIVASHQPAVPGKAVTFRAAVVAGDSDQQRRPTGTVTFTVTGSSGDTVTCGGGSDTVTLDTNAQDQGLASCTIPAGGLVSTDGPYAVHAAYSGDGNFDPSSASLSEKVPG